MTEITEKTATRLEGRALPVVLLTIFIDVLGVSILIPVLPQLIFQIFIPAGYTYDTSLVLLGWLTAIFPLMQFLATPILGQLSDRYGRKPVLIFSLIGTVIGYVIFAIGIATKNIPLIFIGRALDGITGGNLSVARAVISDVSTPKNRTRNFGLIGACFGIGFVMGPYIGARLASPSTSFFGLFNTPDWFGPAVPFWFAAILATVNVLCVIAFLPETHQHINAKLKMHWAKSLTNIKRAATHPSLRIIFTAEFLFWGGFTFFTTFFQILLIKKLGFSQANIGDFFAYIGLWIAISQAALVPFLAKRFSNAAILKVGLFGIGFALLIQLLPNNTTQLLLVAPLIAVFNGMVIANSSSLVSSITGRKSQGEVLGIEASVQALAQAIPAIIAGYVAVVGINLPVIVGGLSSLAGGLIFALFYKPPKKLIEDVEPLEA